METPLVDRPCILQKFRGKGGWTFIEIPEIKPDKNAPFGWVKVRGKIDNYLFSNYRLQPMGNGSLFLPVNAKIRKQIKKQAGDSVYLILYKDNKPLRIPKELVECLQTDPDVYQEFLALTEDKQKDYISWIYDVKKEETRANRIVEMMNKLGTR